MKRTIRKPPLIVYTLVFICCLTQLSYSQKPPAVVRGKQAAMFFYRPGLSNCDDILTAVEQYEVKLVNIDEPGNEGYKTLAKVETGPVLVFINGDAAFALRIADIAMRRGWSQSQAEYTKRFQDNLVYYVPKDAKEARSLLFKYHIKRIKR